MSNEQLLEANFKSIQSDMADLKVSMGKVAEAITRLAVLEERHQAMQSAMNRVVEKLDSLDARQSAMEIAQVKQDTTLKVSMRAVQIAWVVLGSGLMYGAWQLIKLVVLAQAT
jgi:vacuolar-type H+-ATPase subunit E/Vma4